ncbi:MAG: hypothetical protein ABIZ56_05155 [Chthoniobacteraceae bacterium]
MVTDYVALFEDLHAARGLDDVSGGRQGSCAGVTVQTGHRELSGPALVRRV